jgi:hypothetical protein
MRPLIGRALGERPAGCASYQVLPDDAGGRSIHLINHLTLWQRP